MSERLKGGELKQSPSKSGVTISGNKTLEEFIAEEEAKELGEVLTPDNLPSYHKARPKYSEQKEPNGTTRILTRREINAEQWEKIMESQKSIEGVIAALLLSGREVTGREIQNNCVRQLGITKKKYSQRSTYLYHKTDFGKFIISRRSGKGASYKLVPAALECKPEELLYFVYKGNHKSRELVLEHHKGLKPYLEEKPKRTHEELLEEAKEKFKKAKEGKLQSSTKISTAIGDVVSQELGVKVSVSGRVEVIFKWE